MKRYRGVVVFRYYQEVEVEAESQEQAEDMMCGLMDMNRAKDGDCELYDVEEVTGEMK